MSGNSPNPDDLTPEERLDALADVLAEGILSLADTGQMEGFAAGDDADGKSGDMALTSGGNEGTSSCGARGGEDGRKTIGEDCGGE